MTQLAVGHITTHEETLPELNPAYRLLLGPGPCNADPRVLRIASAPQLGHLDPQFFDILEEPERITHANGSLFVIDAVCGLGGVPMAIDEMKIDACYAGSQKSLGALPGLAPVTLNERAVQAIKNRKKPVQSYYLDLQNLDR